MPIDYRAHGGIHQVSIVCCPRILGNRLAHLSQDGPSSWALRDFITRRMIRNSPPPNRASSHHALAEIEAEVTYSEPPPFHAVEHLDDWALYLRLRTSAALGAFKKLQHPNPDFGNWEEMPQV
jgi:hypothetical protein